MMDQVPLGEEARAHETDGGGQSRQIAPDVAYLRTMIANVIFVGARGAGDRSWVLVDAGVMGTESLIVQAASERFGEGARPSAIILTHGHFDHVGVLESLVERWDAPVYAHTLERPYLDGTAAYPPGDPSVGGGMMASLASLYPTKPVNVSSHLRRPASRRIGAGHARLEMDTHAGPRAGSCLVLARDGSRVDRRRCLCHDESRVRL